MGPPSLLGRLLLVIEALLAKAAKAVSKPWQKTLKIVLAIIGSLLRLRSRVNPARKPKNDDTKQPPGDSKNNEARFCIYKDDDGSQTNSTTPHETIPLDSVISCSVHPYPYMQERSRSSLRMSSIRAGARSAHTQAVESRQSSPSSPHPSTQPWNSGSPGGGEDEYTFDVRSPEQPNSPITRYRSPIRGYTMPSPDLGSSETNPQNLGLEWQVSRISSPPPQSIQVLDPEETGVGEDNRPAPRLFHGRIYPLPPDFFSRYDQVKYAEKKETELIIEPMTREFEPKPHPPGWVPVLHPEGVLYWYNEDKDVVTENDLHDQELFDQVSEDLETINDFISTNRIQLPPNITLALELTRDAETRSITTDYYYADHDKRTIFFLDEFNASSFKISHEVKGVTSLAHIQHELEAQYWHHTTLYPSTLPRVQEAASELKDLIFHYIADTSSSPFSTSPFDPEELYKLLSAANGMQGMSRTHQIGAASFISRTMLVIGAGIPSVTDYLPYSALSSAKVLQLVRCSTATPLPRPIGAWSDQKRTWLIKLLSPLLFSAPDAHLSSLHKMWVDGIMHGPVWAKAIKRLNDEWQEFILYATVLLNANVAFLAIQSIDTQEGSYRSPVQVASYLSIVASIGSIIIGLLLIRQNRTRAHGTANDVNLAILYSLPYAMLLWGMVSFLTAFACLCFDSTNICTRVILGCAGVVLVVLVFWCVWTGWVDRETETDGIPVGEPMPPDAPAGNKENAGGSGGDNESDMHEPSRLQCKQSGYGSHVSGLGLLTYAGNLKKGLNWISHAFGHPKQSGSEQTRV
ncbi:hypothetical protein BKA70DRAFT_1564806 [Coprinopsis sp. MPI-PUGE-AT-0042]|nr:hypothetical protein BKA70DRAFT_1564806 [Coprinopsis sp. MPI-PUGE-AT-0042]